MKTLCQRMLLSRLALAVPYHFSISLTCCFTFEHECVHACHLVL